MSCSHLKAVTGFKSMKFTLNLVEEHANTGNSDPLIIFTDAIFFIHHNPYLVNL